MKRDLGIFRKKNDKLIMLVLSFLSAIIITLTPCVWAQETPTLPEPVVAIHVSELTQAMETMPAVFPTPTGPGTTGFEWWPADWHYLVMPESLKESLISDGTPFVEISDADIAAGRLLYPDGFPRYPILISLASEAIADNEIEPLRAYVAAGGILFVGSSAFTRNPDGTTRGDFALANEMGLHKVNASLRNWDLNITFRKIADNRLVSHIPGGAISWRMPLSAEEIPLGVSPRHSVHGDHYVFQVYAADATVIATGDAGPLLAAKQYGNGNFIYHGAMQPLVGHGVYDPAMYAYSIYRNAIEWAFEAANLPIIKLSPWRYQYNAAFIVRHDFENSAESIRSIENSAAFEHSVGAKGDYYFCTGTLRDLMPDRDEVVLSLRRAVTNYGATIGSHNGGLSNPVNTNLSPSEFDYWHWGPDEALNVTPSGYASGKEYARESIELSFQDIEGWLAGVDNGREGCGAAGDCPRNWAAPYFNSTRDGSIEVLGESGVMSSSKGERKISPFPHWTLFYEYPSVRFFHISLPASDWYVGSEIPGAIEWGHTTDSMRAAVDFYYNLGAMINLYGHIPSDAGNIIGQYVLYSVAKPRMWVTNAVEVTDWWLARSSAVVTPSYQVTGSTGIAIAEIAFASDPETAVEIEIPDENNQAPSDLQVFIDGAPADPADYRTIGNVVKVRAGTSASIVEVDYTIDEPTSSNPVPAITNLSPSSAMAGGLAFVLTVNGSGFIDGSVVRWDGSDRTTTFVSSSELSAQITTTDIAMGGTASVTVFNPAPGGGTSNALSFTIEEPTSSNPVPATTNLSPSSATAGGTAFTLTVNGSGFIDGSVVRWDGSDRTTTFVSSSELSAQITAADIATAEAAQVTVFNPAPGGGTSNALSFTIDEPTVSNPVPVTTGLSPTSAMAGDSAFTLTVNGSGFIDGSVVRWDGSDRTTTFVSSSELSAQITATDIATAGAAQVTVFNPAPGGGTSNAQSFTILTADSELFSDDFFRPPDSTDPLLPWVASMGTWSVTGGVLQGTGAPRQYSYASLSTAPQWTDYTVQGSIQMPARSFGGGIGGRLDPTTGAHYGAWVFPAGSPGGSNLLKLWKFRSWTDIGPGVPMQQVSLPAVGTGFHTLNLTFIGNRIQVYYDGSLMIDLTDNNFDSRAPYLSGGISADWWTWSLPYTITIDDVSVVSLSTSGGSAPVITSLDPTSATAGGSAFMLTVTGSGFIDGSVVRWDGSDRTTTFVSSSQLTADITTTDIATDGTASVTVFNPAPGGGTSNALSFTIEEPVVLNPVPAITNLSPSSATAGGSAFMLTVTGSGFIDGSVVRWDGSDRTTTFVSSSELSAQITATDIATDGTASVTVFNPAPGGGTSNALSFTIEEPVVLNPVPATTDLSPSSATAGGSAFVLTVNGSGFIDGSVVRWDGSDRTTTFVSSTQLTADITTTDIATDGTASVTVFNPAPGGGTSNALSFTIEEPVVLNPVPAITSLSPSSATAGGSAFVLTVNGSGFIDGSVVRWDGSDRTTTFVSSSQLTADITTTDIATDGTASVTVFNPAPGGGTSNALSFTIEEPVVLNPVPAITSLSPSSATAGGTAFTLTVNGSGFIDGSVVRWDGSDRTTTFVSSTQLTADITTTDIATDGTASVTVFNPAPGGGTSNALSFTIEEPVVLNPVPAITSLSPSSATAGGSAFVLTVNGSGFIDGSVVRWDGSDRTTTFVSSSQLTADITTTDIATDGTASVTVFNPAPGGGTSNALSFTIEEPVVLNPVPAITNLSPSSATAGDTAFTLTVNGSGFIDGSVVRWDGSDRTTTFVSSSQLTADITTTDIATDGTASVTVFNPAPGGGTSNALSFTIEEPVVLNPVPAITNLSPSSATAGGSAFVLTVNGSGFIDGSVVRWDGSDRTTTFVSSSQLTADITTTDIATDGTASVTVFNPAPGGGTSNALSFTIEEPVVLNPVPAITNLSPSSATAGDTAFTLTVNGSGFIDGSVVRWDGSDRTTTFVSSSQLTADITTTDIATDGTASVTVFNPAPGGGTSNALSFTILTADSELFSDDFTRPPDSTDPLLPWVASMGTWSVTGGVLQGTGAPQQYSYASLSTAPQWTDYTVQGSIQMPAGSFGGGIGGRLDPTTGAHYGAWVYPAGSPGGSNLLKLWKFRSWTDIGPGVPMQQVSLPAVGTGFHTLNLTFIGNRIQVYYDGSLMIDLTDNNFDSRAPYLSGGISADWWTWSLPYTITIDDLSVVTP